MTPVIRTSSLAGFVELVDELGGDPDALLRKVHLRRRDLEDATALIPYATVVHLLATAAEELECSDIGLRLSQRQSIDIMGPVAVIARNSKTVGDALDSIFKYMSYYCTAVAPALVPANPGNVFFTLDYAVPDTPRHRQKVELSLAVMNEVMRLLTHGRFVAESVLFRHEQAMPAAVYRKYFRTRVRFDEPRDALLFKSDILARPLNQADPSLRAVVADFVERAINTQPSDLASQVSILIEKLLPTMRCNLSMVADKLGCHERTIQRRLAQQGTSFEDLLDEVRRRRAGIYLAERSIPMVQIAGMLGYAEQSSLTRACQRWFGHTPRARRRTLTGDPVPRPRGRSSAHVRDMDTP
jgi:AraC-like DNA-binding protein